MHRHYFTNKNKLLTCSIHLMWKLGISFDGQTTEWTYFHWLVKENGQCLVSISLQIQPLNCLEEFKRSKAEVILLSSLLWVEVRAHQSNRVSCSRTSPPFLPMDFEHREAGSGNGLRWEEGGSWPVRKRLFFSSCRYIKQRKVIFFFRDKIKLKLLFKKSVTIRWVYIYLKKSEKKKVKESWENHGALWGITTCYSLMSSHIPDS